jgi:hypothetical protein
MAYFYGMYINGIAVYGRDPLLTCEYAHFVSQDQHCPMRSHEDESESPWKHVDVFSLLWMIFPPSFSDHNLHPSDWRNCSSKGYHP